MGSITRKFWNGTAILVYSYTHEIHKWIVPVLSIHLCISCLCSTPTQPSDVQIQWNMDTPGIPTMQSFSRQLLCQDSFKFSRQLCNHGFPRQRCILVLETLLLASLYNVCSKMAVFTTKYVTAKSLTYVIHVWFKCSVTQCCYLSWSITWHRKDQNLCTVW